MSRFYKLTKRQAEVFEQIAVGNDECVHPRTADALLRRGLIVEREEDVVSGIRGVRLTLRRYEVPIPVHMEWCAWCAARPQE